MRQPFRICICTLMMIGAAAASSRAFAQPAEPPPGIITLEQALARALENNPRLAVFPHDIRVAEARMLQAGLRPNPELALEVETIRLFDNAGETTRERSLTLGWEDSGLAPGVATSRERTSGGSSVFGAAKATLSLSQTIELGGKRAKRLRAAALERDLAAWGYEVARAEVAIETARAYYDVLHAQQRLELTAELLHLAEQVDNTVRDRVDAGEAAGLERKRSQTERTAAEIEHQRARRTLDAAMAALAALWAASKPDFDGVAGDFGPFNALPAPDSLYERIESNPDIARWVQELEQREAVVALEQSARVPDLTVGLGVEVQGLEGSRAETREWSTSGLAFSRNHIEPDRDVDTTFVLEASIPLPLFNRNQGNVRAAEALAEKASAERRAAVNDVRAAVTAWHTRVQSALDELAKLREELLPAAQEAHELTLEGYRQGKFDLVAALDTERALFEARMNELDAKAAFQRGVAELERLIGGPVDSADAEEHIVP